MRAYESNQTREPALHNAASKDSPRLRNDSKLLRRPGQDKIGRSKDFRLPYGRRKSIPISGSSLPNSSLFPSRLRHTLDLWFTSCVEKQDRCNNLSTHGMRLSELVRRAATSIQLDRKLTHIGSGRLLRIARREQDGILPATTFRSIALAHACAPPNSMVFELSASAT